MGSDFLSREEILAAQDTVYETVDVPEWGGKKVRIRSASAKEREEYEKSTFKWVRVGDGWQRVQDPVGMRVSGVVLGVVDGQGRQVFTREDAQALMQKNSAAIQRIWLAWLRLSSMGEEAVAAAGEASGSGPNDASPSDSLPV